MISREIYYATMALIAVLFVIRGLKWRGPMIVAITVLLGLVLGFKYGWLTGLLTFGVSNVIRLGYGNYEEGEDNSLLGELTKDHEGWLVRLLWGLIVSSVICLPLVILKHKYSLPLWYIPLNTVVNYSVSALRLPSLVTDILVGLSLSTIII